jgi:hypothetical protein
VVPLRCFRLPRNVFLRFLRLRLTILRCHHYQLPKFPLQQLLRPPIQVRQIHPLLRSLRLPLPQGLILIQALLARFRPQYRLLLLQFHFLF